MNVFSSGIESIANTIAQTLKAHLSGIVGELADDNHMFQ